MEKALEALHASAKKIREIDGIENVTVENDNDSGEIYFEVDGQDFVLSLKKV